MNETNGRRTNEKLQKAFSQVALSNDAIKVVDEMIQLEGSDRLGGRSLSRADILNDLLIRKGAEKLRQFYYAKS